MGEMRAKLDAGLKDPKRPVEEQERIIEWAGFNLCATCPLIMCRILIDLEQSDEPAWAYLEYQHAHILETMRTSHTRAQETVKGLSNLPISFTNLT